MLAFVLAVSSFAFGFSSESRAHEVSPTIADIEIVNSHVNLKYRITLESFLAEIDLDAAEDTNNVPQAEAYDTLRALPPSELERRFRAYVPQFLSSAAVRLDGIALPLEITSISIPEVEDVELPRISEVVFEGAADDKAETFRLDWPAGFGTLILRQMGPDDPYTGYIAGGQSSPDILIAGGEARSFLSVFAEYIPVGFDHILPKGLDHILFVLGLFFFSTALRPLLVQVTSFTLAHTVTLALGALGIVTIPGNIVEPIIAASIVYVAVENVVSSKMNPWRPAIIFIFGLLHGLGFASVLGEFGLPAGQFVAALIGFNVGVEIGQLTVIAIAFGLVGYWFGKKDWYRTRIAIPVSLCIAAVGAYWFVQRVFL